MQLGSPTGMYGAERWIMALVNHLDPSEVESVVGVIKDDPKLEAPLCLHAARAGFQTHVVEAMGKINWKAVRDLRAYITETKVDILHTHGYKMDIIGVLAACGTPCRVVATPHGWSVGAGLALQVYETIDRLAFALCDAVAPLSAKIYDELNRLPFLRRKLHLIRNAVDITEIDATHNVASEIAAWKEQGQYVVGYVGQLIPRKGLDVLLRAFAALPVRDKKLAIVGDGPHREELQRLAQQLGLDQDVRFFGFRSDRLALLKGFDVFVLPSLLEGIPRCLMEALAAEVAVIATDIPGCSDLIQHGSTGLLFRPGDVETLTEHLSALRTQEGREPFVSNGRRHVVENYSAGAMARNYQALFRTLLSP